MMNTLSAIAACFNKPRINFWKVTAGIGGLQLVINAKTFYENNAIKDQALRSRFLNWQFSWTYLVQQLLSLTLASLLCFLLFNIVYQLSVTKRPWHSFALQLLPLLGMLLAVDIAINYFFYPDSIALLGNNPLLYFSDFLFGVAVLAIATLIVVKVAIYNDIASRNRELELTNTRLALEKKKADMELLKAQVNPHFLYNSLNYLYAKSLPHAKELSEGIMVLSEIMKYAFHTPDENNDGLVSLKEEVDYIGKYLRMSNLRFGDAFHATFKQEGTSDQTRIIPFALFTIVENAVKHADATDAHHPIRIGLKISNQQLHFSCCNKKKTGQALKETTQTGLDNLKGRLAAAYGSRYELQIVDTQDQYLINLSISLAHDH